MKKRIAIAVAFMCLLAMPVAAAVESGVYKVVPGASVVESGDRVTNGMRVIPLSATLQFDLSASPRSVTAWITNAVWEGGNPFPLTVRGSYAYQPSNGTYTFSGDYLQDKYPSETQYLFDWTFSPSTNGLVLWNGYTYWAGGHLWQIAISNITLVPQPWLTIAANGSSSAQIGWSTNFPDHLLEHASNLPTAIWGTVTNIPSTTGGRYSVIVDTYAPQEFYRLRKP